MKIKQLLTDRDFVQRHLEDLHNLLDQPNTQEARPCLDCQEICPDCGSNTCSCRCTPRCEMAAKQLSSDGHRYPIENKILPLVFELNTLRVCQPCWSCEGHSSNENEVKKIPRVWFYSRSLIYPRLISDYLQGLLFEKKIHYPWHICVTFSPVENIDTSFSIEPNLNFINHPQLNHLQNDVNTIANSLVNSIKRAAENHLKQHQ